MNEIVFLEEDTEPIVNEHPLDMIPVLKNIIEEINREIRSMSCFRDNETRKHIQRLRCHRKLFETRLKKEQDNIIVLS